MKKSGILVLAVSMALLIGVFRVDAQQSDPIGVYNEWGQLREVFLGIEDDTIEPEYVPSLVWVPGDGVEYLKKYGGEILKAGNIIIKQCGTKIHAGRNVGTGKDYTLYAKIAGRLLFKTGRGDRKYAHVDPIVAA